MQAQLRAVPRPPEACRFERRFTLDSLPRSGTLRFAADFASATIEINSRTVAAVEPFSPTLDLDVTTALRSGDNQIIVDVKAVPGPSAIALSLRPYRG